MVVSEIYTRASRAYANSQYTFIYIPWKANDEIYTMSILARPTFLFCPPWGDARDGSEPKDFFFLA